MNAETLPVRLTMDERMAVAQRLLRVFRDIEEEQKSFEQAKAGMKARVKEMEDETLKLRRVFESGQEDRMVGTRRVVGKLNVEIRRADTGELLRIEDLTEEDRQGNLRFVPEPEQEKANE